MGGLELNRGRTGIELEDWNGRENRSTLISVEKYTPSVTPQLEAWSLRPA